MDQVISKETVKTEIIHNFFCDGCNKSLGSSKELDDGYYDIIGEYHYDIILSGLGRFVIDKCLCDNCRKELDKKIKTSLEDLGFTSPC
jgi:uncharacterized protein YlaI